MSINQITIKNYKSLQNLTLNLKPFLVFIGPNNAGKSNIFDCLRFLSDFVKSGNAARQRGGFEQIVFNGDISQEISIELRGSIKVKDEQPPAPFGKGDKERCYRYFIEFEGDRWGNCLNKREIFNLLEDSEQILLEFPREKGMAIAFDETGKQTGSIGGGRDRLYLYSFSDEYLFPILGHFSKEVQNWAFFNLLPPLMRASLPVRKELQLQSSGENLPVVLHVLQTEYPEKFKEIEDILKSALPEVEELATGLTAHEAAQTYIRIREKGLKTSIPAWGMSDGTLRLLGHLATLYLPQPPPLVCFEEPENYVHPRLLELIVDLLKYPPTPNPSREGSETQVLVTTHSPYLIDRLEPEDLMIVEKKEGKTEVKGVDDIKEIKEALKTLTLGEMWYSGDLGGVP